LSITLKISLSLATPSFQVQGVDFNDSYPMVEINNEEVGSLAFSYGANS